MTFKTTLIGGAALGAMMAVSAVGSADATTTKTTKKHTTTHTTTRTTTTSTGSSELRAQVDQLQNQVRTLESRLDSQARAAEQAQADARAAQAAAQDAQAKAQAASAQIDEIPGRVDGAVKNAMPKPGWWANTTVGGVLWIDASYIHNTAQGAGSSLKCAPNGPCYTTKPYGNYYYADSSSANVDIKRFYIIINHKINRIWSANLTTDFNYDSGPAGATQLYIKKAYIQGSFSNLFNVRLGDADLAWVPYVEGLYGYRWVENTTIDRAKYGTSTDVGVHVYGTAFNKVLGYQVSIIDGSGYKKPAIGNGVNRTDSLDIDYRLNASFGGFNAGIGGYWGQLGATAGVLGGTPNYYTDTCAVLTGGALPSTNGTASSNFNTCTYHTAERMDALLAYVGPFFRIGGEYMYAKYWKDVTQANQAKTNSSETYGVWGSVNFLPKWALFARYDWVKPQRNTAPGFTDNYYNIGISYSPYKQLDVAMVYKHENSYNGVFSSSNGAVGVAGAYSGRYDEVGLWTAYKF
jgi:outer membrane murein-binding lipoprotein Lpp